MQFSCEWCVEMKNRPLGRAILGALDIWRIIKVGMATS